MASGHHSPFLILWNSLGALSVFLTGLWGIQSLKSMGQRASTDGEASISRRSFEICFFCITFGEITSETSVG